MTRKGPGIKITGNGENISNLKKSVTHFKESRVRMTLPPQVERIKEKLGSFYPSKSFKPPKGTVEP